MAGQELLANKVKAHATAMASNSYRPVLPTNQKHVVPSTNPQQDDLDASSLKAHACMIDYVITRKNDASDVRVTKSMCGAECWTDHRLL